MFADLLNSNGLRVLAYAVVAAVCFAAFVYERGPARRNYRYLWPLFWLLTGGLLLTMALARLGDVSALVAEAGRAEARDAGWYEARRPAQAGVVGVMTVAWAVSVLLVVWRVPERRRRYVPPTVAVLTLVCFAVVRAVSLHHLDQLLYNRPVFGVRLASAMELFGLALTVVIVAWSLTIRPGPGQREPPGRRETVAEMRTPV